MTACLGQPANGERFNGLEDQGVSYLGGLFPTPMRARARTSSRLQRPVEKLALNRLLSPQLALDALPERVPGQLLRIRPLNQLPEMRTVLERLGSKDFVVVDVGERRLDAAYPPPVGTVYASTSGRKRAQPPRRS